MKITIQELKSRLCNSSCSFIFVPPGCFKTIHVNGQGPNQHTPPLNKIFLLSINESIQKIHSRMNYQRHTKLIPSSPEKNPMNSSTRQDGANMNVHMYIPIRDYTCLYIYMKTTIGYYKKNMSSNYIIHTKVGARSKKTLDRPRSHWSSPTRRSMSFRRKERLRETKRARCRYPDSPIKLTQQGRCQNKKRNIGNLQEVFL